MIQVWDRAHKFIYSSNWSEIYSVWIIALFFLEWEWVVYKRNSQRRTHLFQRWEGISIWRVQILSRGKKKNLKKLIPNKSPEFLACVPWSPRFKVLLPKRDLSRYTYQTRVHENQNCLSTTMQFKHIVPYISPIISKHREANQHPTCTHIPMVLRELTA